MSISKSATASPGTGGPRAYRHPAAPRLPGPYLCRMALMTWCAPSPWYSQVCWLLRTRSLIFTFWLPMYLWKSWIFSCLNSSKLSTPREERKSWLTLVQVLGVLYLEMPPAEGSSESAFLQLCPPRAAPHRCRITGPSNALDFSRHTATCKSKALVATQGQNRDRQYTILNFKKLLKHKPLHQKRETAITVLTHAVPQLKTLRHLTPWGLLLRFLNRHV